MFGRALACAIVLLAAGCGDSGGGSTTQAAPPIGGSTVSGRCLVVPPDVVTGIQTRLDKGLSLRRAQAVRSLDFRSVVFISADVQGKGFEGRNDIATWATNNLTYGGVTFSIDARAKKISHWGNGAQFQPKLTLDNEGAKLSRACVGGVA